MDAKWEILEKFREKEEKENENDPYRCLNSRKSPAVRGRTILLDAEFARSRSREYIRPRKDAIASPDFKPDILNSNECLQGSPPVHCEIFTQPVRFCSDYFPPDRFTPSVSPCNSNFEP